jgi:hypothetical protein
MFNPYELLGVTIDSTLQDVKKSYYELSLIVHPDKGGNTDDMSCLHRAYLFVRKELEQVNRTKTVEDLQNEFSAFCDEQKERIPLFQDIYAEAFDLPKFNDYFKAQQTSEKIIKPYLEGGYGDYMDASCVQIDYNPTETASVQKQFSTAIQVYLAPAEMKVCENVYDMTVKTVDDFTMSLERLHMADYCGAYTSTLQDVVCDIPCRSLEDLLKERENTKYDVNHYDDREWMQRIIDCKNTNVLSETKKLVYDSFDL